ncbi:hypothetical protein BT96DRAFT_927142 [Gymnopus androsaceus JB14]|uniref:Uncharacterized protein n=1 Tax=Gymnopus androsaceus JB14 TaxID=1447944 RepID=A0A6A4GRG5_9AGAR|nr:hypothetical protein BT96DRAFT_927142 [Gymnopus androsaceus JB14]
MVGVISLLDLLHSILVWKGLWDWFIKMFGDDSASTIIPMCFASSVFIILALWCF